MVVTSNIELERILLHSCATSTVKPGIASLTPSCATGTPAAVKSTYADQADPCCNRCTISLSTSCGSGTNPKRKHSGKRTDRETREPKQRTNAPIQQITSANMPSESRTSEEREDHPLTKPATKTAIASITEPVRTFEATIGRRECHS